MKKDRNCNDGMAPYPIYPIYQPNMMIPAQPNMIGPNMIPSNPSYNYNVPNYQTSSSTIEQQLNNLNSQINLLERRVNNLENLIGNSSNQYNTSNYQVM